jgi:RND family efflux transporter MFP subunit
MGEDESRGASGGHYGSESKHLRETGVMAVVESGMVSKHLRLLLRAGTVVGFSDRELLTRFLHRRDELAEAAFAAIVERHGPMVLSVCRGVLENPHDAEDAFQATFLVLAMRASAVRNQDSLASWLFGVARRAAMKAKVAAGRRRLREKRGAEMVGPLKTTEQAEHWSDLHEEVDRLPEMYRAPIVLCYFEGLSHEVAADQLGLPLGTVKVRLSRGRERLRGRLAPRGMAPVLLAAAASGKARIVMPTSLLDSTVHSVLETASGRLAGVSAPVSDLVKGVLRNMFLSKLRTAAGFLAAGLSVLCATIFAFSLAPRSARSDPPSTPTRSANASQNVTVETLKKSDFVQNTTHAGTVEAFEAVELTPRLSGYLKSLKVDIGDTVKQGQVLAEIDAPELDADREKSQAVVEQAQAQVARANAHLIVGRASLDAEAAKSDAAGSMRERAEAALRYREKGLERFKELAAQKAIDLPLVDEAVDRVEAARSELASATAQAKTARAGVDEAKAKLMESQALIGQAEADLRVALAEQKKTEIRQGYATLVSPLDGVVTRRRSQVGDFVRSGEGGAESLLTIMRTGRMRVVVAIPDRDVPQLSLGDQATVRVASDSEHEYHGTVSRMAFAEDPANRTLRAEIDLENKGRLRPGQFVVVDITLQNRSHVLTIPLSALVSQRAGGEAECYRVVDKHAVLTRVKTGDDNAMRIEILDGLKEGDTVITHPDPALTDGQEIDVKTSDEPQKKGA